MSRILPSHPHRRYEEIFSSWILRVASGNGVSVRDLCRSLAETRNIQRLDLMWPNDPLVSSLAEATSVRVGLVRQALLASLQGLFGNGINECRPYNQAFPWHLRTGSPSPNVGGQYCIDCLREYRCYQLSWRISVYGCCLLHKKLPSRVLPALR